MGKVGYGNPRIRDSRPTDTSMASTISRACGGSTANTVQQHEAVAPWLALQGGWKQHAGQSYVGKINSQVFGAQLGTNIAKNIQLTVGYDRDPLENRHGVLAEERDLQQRQQSNHREGSDARVFPAAECRAVLQQSKRHDEIYYGGWASPYTDNYDSDPLFTTSVTQGMADRRAAGTRSKSRSNTHRPTRNGSSSRPMLGTTTATRWRPRTPTSGFSTDAIALAICRQPEPTAAYRCATATSNAPFRTRSAAPRTRRAARRFVDRRVGVRRSPALQIQSRPARVRLLRIPDSA